MTNFALPNGEVKIWVPRIWTLVTRRPQGQEWALPDGHKTRGGDGVGREDASRCVHHMHSPQDMQKLVDGWAGSVGGKLTFIYKSPEIGVTSIDPSDPWWGAFKGALAAAR